jgi:hypothetical protein
VLAAGAWALAGCNNSVDVIPENALPRDIQLRPSTLPLTGLSVDARKLGPPLLIDTGTYLTVLSHQFTGLAPGLTPVKRMGLLAGTPPAEQLAFGDLQVVVSELQPIGATGRLPVSGVLGSDILSQFLVTLDYSDQLLTLDDRVIDDPETLEGSVGMTLVGGTNVSIENGTDENLQEHLPSLVVAPGCLNFALNPDSGEVGGGTDVSVLVATGQARTVVAGSAARRLGLQLGPATQLYTTGGSYPAHVARLESVALVTDLDVQRSPCQEMALARRFIRGPRTSAVAALDTASLVWLTEPREVLVVEDEVAGPVPSPWDSLRNQTKPRVPIIDVLLGSDYLSWTQVSIDYQDRRLVFQCRTDRDCPGCTVAPCIRQAHCNATRLPELPPLPGAPDGGTADAGGATGDGGTVLTRPTTPRFDVRLCLPFP